MFKQLTGKAVIALPIGTCDVMPHSRNENLKLDDYIQEIKAMAAYLFELAESFD